MGVFKRNRSQTRAIPDMSRVDIMEYQLKELRNRVWRALSRALQLEQIRKLAGRVNRWFDKHAPWRQGQRRGRVSPEPQAEMAKEEKKPEIRINRDGAQNILILTNSPIMSMSANYDLDQAERAIIEDILKPDVEFPEVKPRKKVRFQVYEEPDPDDEDSVTRLLMHMNSNKRSTHNKDTTKIKGILKNLGPSPCAALSSAKHTDYPETTNATENNKRGKNQQTRIGIKYLSKNNLPRIRLIRAESGDATVETFKELIRSPLSPIEEIEENNDSKLQGKFDSDEEIDNAIGDIVRNMELCVSTGRKFRQR